jgi:hypothetical protein
VPLPYKAGDDGTDFGVPGWNPGRCKGFVSSPRRSDRPGRGVDPSSRSNAEVNERRYIFYEHLPACFRGTHRYSFTVYLSVLNRLALLKFFWVWVGFTLFTGHEGP